MGSSAICAYGWGFCSFCAVPGIVSAGTFYTLSRLIAIHGRVPRCLVSIALDRGLVGLISFPVDLDIFYEAHMINSG